MIWWAHDGSRLVNVFAVYRIILPALPSVRNDEDNKVGFGEREFLLTVRLIIIILLSLEASQPIMSTSSFLNKIRCHKNAN